MIIVQQRPESMFDALPSKLSKWNCSQSPVIFTLQRADDIFTQIVAAASPTEIIVKIPGVSTVPSTFSIGDTINVYTAFYLNQQGVITNIAGGGGVTWDITLDIPFTFPSSGGYLQNLSRQGYNVEIAIKGYNRSRFAYETFATMVAELGAAPAKINVGRNRSGPGFLNRYVSYYNENITVRNLLNPNLGSWFYLEFLEKWQGSANTVQVDGTPNISYFVSAKKNIQHDDYKSNLAAYVTFPILAGATKAKFLRDFERPTWFVGLPFELAYIFHEELPGFQITLEHEYKTAGGTSISSGDADLDTTQPVGVHRLLMIGQLDGDDALPSGTDNIDLWLQANSIAQRGYVASGYVAPGYDELVPPTVVAMDPLILTEVLNVKVVQGCSNNILVRWVGSFGQYNFWAFNRTSIISNKGKNESFRERNNEDLGTAYAVKEVIQRSNTEQLTLFTRIAQEDYSGMKSIEDSNEWHLWENGRWKSIILESSSLKHKSTQASIPVEITFSLPENYTLSK